MNVETTPKLEMQPHLPPSLLEKRVKWDVFLSFRGADTRYEFTTPLRDALKLKGLTPFMDDEGMERGDTIQSSLDEAIVDSALTVAIISPKYADSHWCLKELCLIFDCKKRVIPVFCEVGPSDVRSQSGVFGKGFKKVLDECPKRFSEDDIMNWRNALKNVASIPGFTCPKISGDHTEVMHAIVKQVWSELKDTTESEVKLNVGLNHRVEKVVDMLDLANKDVRFLNIHGAPGIGKTTLAKAVYSELVVNFENRCFIANVTEKLSREGGILSVKNEIMNALGYTHSLEQVVNKTRMLLVLDDVSKPEHLADLNIVREWFDEGSRIIITSIAANTLHELASNNDVMYEVEKLDASESLQLFSIHALGRLEPTSEYKQISKKIVSLMGGLPLALEVFGSFLVKKSLKKWNDALKELECNEPQNLEKVLKLCYHGLQDNEKLAFLDISCLLLQNDMTRDDIVDVLAGCGLAAELAIGELVVKSLLKISKENKLWMHDQIREMGRRIVTQENDEVGNRSRLWDSMDTKCVLPQEKQVTEAVRGIVLNIKKPADISDNKMTWFNFRRPSRLTSNEDDHSVLHTKWFKKMKNLKLLQMDYAILEGDLKDMPSDLRWLQWKGCPLKSLPIHIPEELRVLDLSSSNIEQLWSTGRSLWSSNKVVGKLVVLNLSNCAKLTDLPDMSGHKELKKLNLENCVGLTKIHESVGSMSSLVHLNLRGCINLVALPRDVTGMKGLKVLNLSNCSKVSELPQDVRSMKSLNQLLLDGTSITELPKSIFHLRQLEVVRLNSCFRSAEFIGLSIYIESLTSLTEISYSGTKPKIRSSFFHRSNGN